jgi:hypothetical protein
MASMADTMPELVLVAETDPAAARRVRRLAVQGVLKRLYPSIYTSNVDSPPESIVCGTGRRSSGICCRAV